MVEKGQAIAAWEHLITNDVSRGILSTLAGRRLTWDLSDPPEPGPGDPRHRAADFLIEFGEALLNGNPKPKAERGKMVEKLLAIDPNTRPLPMEDPEPEIKEVESPDGCPLSVVGSLLWLDRSIDGIPVMNSSEMDWHLGKARGYTTRLIQRGQIPMTLYHRISDPGKPRAKYAFIRSEARRYFAVRNLMGR